MMNGAHVATAAARTDYVATRSSHMTNDMETEFTQLVDSLQELLPTRPEQIDKVKELVSIAEAYGVVVSQYVRLLSQKFAEESDQVMRDLKRGVVYDEEGNASYDKARAAEYKAFNADEKKVAIAGIMADTTAKLEYVKNLDNLIKRRVSVGQSFMKSVLENKS